MMYLRNTFINHARFIGIAVFGALALGYGAASYAQAEVEEVLEEIVVTGSYIPRTSLVTPTPIMTLDTASIEGSGLTNMGDLLLELPAVNIGITPTGSQSGTDQGGLYSINLRDLGTDRTLTLVDGRRVASNRPGANLVSTNTIPDEMVERVEVITGGASAVYGSDAIAGVVNFILKDDFEGISFKTKAGQSEHGGGDKTTASLTMGSNFVQDRGNVIFNITFDKATEILGNERDYYLTDKRMVREDGVLINEVEPTFSSTSPISRIDIAEAPSDIDRWRVEPGPEGSDRDSRTFDSFSTNDHGYNSQNFQSQFGPYERLMASTKMIFNVTDQHQVFAQAFFVSDKTDSFTNPEGLDQEDANPGVSTINPDLAGVSLNYPWLPTQIRQVATDVLFNPDGSLTQDALDFGCAAGDVACANDLGIVSWRKRFFSQGRRTKPNTRDTLRLATGFEGEIWQDWSYNLAYSFGRANQSQVQTPDFVRPNFSASLDVEPDPENPGSFRCADANARNRSCVPLDLWKGGDDLTPEEIRWLTSKALYQAEAETTQVLANISGDLWDMPAGPVGFATGYEYRKEYARTRTDTLSEQRGITTSALPSGEGDFDVHEVFVEALIPLTDSFNTEFAVRYADYSTVGGVTSYKAGFDWAPIDAVRFRGMYARAQRAPNLRESQLAPRETGIGFDDPCDGINGQDIIDGDATAVSCAREHPWFNDNLLDGAGNPVIDPDGNGTDLLEFVFDDDTVSRGFTNPNPDLVEETADTYTFGVVLTPDQWIPGLGMTIDYYSIEVDDVMANSSRQETLDLCFSEVVRNPDCDFISRNGLGQVFRVDAIVRNQDSLEVEGIDFYLSYDFRLDGLLSIPGDFRLSGNYSHKIDHTITRINQLTGEPIVTNEVGEVGDIENRARFGLAYDYENWNVNMRVLWYGETFPENDVIDDQREALAGIAAGDPEYDDFVADGFVAATIDELTVSDIWYLNLNVNYDWNTDRDYALRLSAGINNVFDQDPAQPLHSRLYSSQARSRCGSECSIYENIGRYYWLGFRMDL